MRNVLRLIIVFLLILIIIFLIWWFFFRNKPPVAVDNVFMTVVETAVSGNIIDDDQDPEMEPLQLDTTPVSLPANGSVQLEASGVVNYAPTPGFSGNDQFRYRVCDPQNRCSEANVNITVNPIAVDDTFTTTVNTAVSGNVLVNDKGSNLTATAPATTGLMLQPNGDFTFEPATNFTGTTTFSYEACDGTPLCDSAVVTIMVETVGFELQSDSYTTWKNTAVSGNVLDNDSDNTLPVTNTPTVAPTSGVVTLETSGVFTYTPNTDFVGVDNFTYQVCDPGCLTAPVTITVTDGPILDPDVMITYVNNAVSDNVLTNDMGDGLFVDLSASPGNGPTDGTADMQTDGTTTYTPNPGFTGTDSFTYKACDNGGVCAETTVSVEIANPPSPLVHTVEQGDWLIQLARCYGTSVAAIRGANYLPNPHYLRPGQKLTIPQVNSLGNFTGPSCVQRYFVKAGDTTASIAAQFGIKESELRRINGIPYPNGYYLRVGQLIVVPRPVPDYMLP